MKRQKYYSDDVSDDDKPAFRDWSRRDSDQDRPQSSSHRRFYSSKGDSGRKLSSSSSFYDRDDDREPLLPRPLRKRPFDHELELDRRKFSFDRYREGGGGERDRDRPVSSPRQGYGSCSSDRMRRSESFSVSRREFPKGVRSERDRSRREGSTSGSSWRRSSSWKEFADDEVRSRAPPPPPPPQPQPLPSHSSVTALIGGPDETVGRGSNRLVSESRSRSRSKESSSGEPTRSIEVKKPKEIIKERNISSDMEEGEFEPDPRPAPQVTPKPLARNHVERPKVTPEPNIRNHVERSPSTPEPLFQNHVELHQATPEPLFQNHVELHQATPEPLIQNRPQATLERLEQSPGSASQSRLRSEYTSDNGVRSINTPETDVRAVCEEKMQLDVSEDACRPEPLAQKHVEQSGESEIHSGIRTEDASESDIKSVDASEAHVQPVSEEKLQLDEAEDSCIPGDDDSPHDCSKEALDTQIDEHQKPTEDEVGAALEVAKEMTVTAALAAAIPIQEVEAEGDLSEMTQQHRASPNQDFDRAAVAASVPTQEVDTERDLAEMMQHHRASPSRESDRAAVAAPVPTQEVDAHRDLAEMTKQHRASPSRESDRAAVAAPLLTQAADAECDLAEMTQQHRAFPSRELDTAALAAPVQTQEVDAERDLAEMTQQHRASPSRESDRASVAAPVPIQEADTECDLAEMTQQHRASPSCESDRGAVAAPVPTQEANTERDLAEMTQQRCASPSCESDRAAVAAPLQSQEVDTERDLAEMAQQHRASPSRESDDTMKESMCEEGSQNAPYDPAPLSPSQPEVEGKQIAKSDIKLDALNVNVIRDGSTAMEIEEHAEPGVSQVEVTVDQIEPVAGHGHEMENIDMEVEPENAAGPFAIIDNASIGSKSDAVTLGLMQSLSKDCCRDKGKSLAVSPSSDADFAEEDDPMEGPSNRGFELVFLSKPAVKDKVVSRGVIIDARKDDRLDVESLDLSLGLPGFSADSPTQNVCPKPDSPHKARSVQLLSSSFPSKSDNFTTSISYSGSQSFFHNPSCSLTQMSAENYEHSVGSYPIFKEIDQVPGGPVWQGQFPNDPKEKGEGIPSHQIILQNGSLSKQSLNVSHEHPHHKANGFLQKSNSSKFLPRSRVIKLEQSEEHRTHNKETSNDNLLPSEQYAARRGSDVSNFKKVLRKLISEPFPVTGRRFQELSQQAISSLKEAITDTIVNKDYHAELLGLKDQLHRRSDLTPEVLSKCHRDLLEILVAIKTGIPDFLGRMNSASSSDLVEVFLSMRCKNLSCRSILPVDDCDCKLCKSNNGFCSSCMCLVCLNFDNAADTCSWVGCDICSHWCHTDCALRHSHIRNSESTHGRTEMQFHCTACGQPSEMFGFVKEVFRTCATNWKTETFAKELEFVRRIFSASDDARGKRLHCVASELLLKVGKNANPSEVFNNVMEFFADNDTNFSGSSKFVSKVVPGGDVNQKLNGVRDGAKANGFSKELCSWLPSIPSESHRDIGSSGLTLNADRLGRRIEHVELRYAEKNNPDELDSIVKFKREEAKMYQSRADEARKEAESLKRIAIAKNEKIDEDYSSQIGMLRLLESEERRRKKNEELQILERTQDEYLKMKMKMDSEFVSLLSKLEAVKHNLHS